MKKYNDQFLYKKLRLKKNILSFLLSLFRVLLLIELSFVILYPLVVKSGVSLMSVSDLIDQTIVLLPKNPTLSNYRIVWEAVDYLPTFTYTIGITVLVSLLQLISTTLVAYGLARFSFKGSKLLYVCVIFTLVVPVQAILTPLYIRFRFFNPMQFVQIGGELSGVSLINTVVPIILLSATATAFKNGLFILMLLQYFKNQPKVLEEAAYVDGCGRFKTFIRIMVPGAVPMLVTIFLFAFVWQWTDYYYSAIFMPEGGLLARKLLSIDFSLSGGLSSQLSEAVSYAPKLMLLIIPLIILYLFTQRFFVESIERSGIVG
ncbi:MAG: carbohydrate ABC transporter permease [Clostridia bacterium]|nr:carbohydrate ABC transporter permease [Clostridia bacterium]